MPCYRYLDIPFYGSGLKIYDMLAGKAGLGNTEFLNGRNVERCLPGVRISGLKGGVKYWDGQFDDARLALVLARSAAAQGALRSEEHTSELQSVMLISYAVFCLKKKKHTETTSCSS